MRISIESNDSDEEVQCVACDMILGAEALQVFAYGEDPPDEWQMGIICDKCLEKGPELCAKALYQDANDMDLNMDSLSAEGTRVQAYEIETSGSWPTLRDLEAAWETSGV